MRFVSEIFLGPDKSRKLVETLRWQATNPRQLEMKINVAGKLAGTQPEDCPILIITRRIPDGEKHIGQTFLNL